MANRRVLYHPNYVQGIARAAMRHAKEIQQLRDDIRHERNQIREERHALRAELDAAWAELRRLQQIDRVQRAEGDIAAVMAVLEAHNRPLH